MGILRHEHMVLRNQPDATHVDSFGAKFGANEHKDIADSFPWKDEDDKTKPIEHVHRDIEEAREERTKVTVWIYRPRSKSEAEREVGRGLVETRHSVVKRSVPEGDEKAFA